MQRGFETLKFIAKMNFAAHSTVIRTNGHGPDGLHPFAVVVITRIAYLPNIQVFDLCKMSTSRTVETRFRILLVTVTTNWRIDTSNDIRLCKLLLTILAHFTIVKYLLGLW